ncbi:MAG: hypothetical protein IJL92_11460 [Thermoguttaceae bacterium]|nr:hypothetical protein [Thermoguttaceae bacterium]
MRNTGVTVSLIVFMVLSLILGVTTYIGAKGTSEKKMQVASFKKATSDAQSRNSAMKNDLKSLKEKLGYDAVEDNAQLVETMKADVVASLGAVEDAASYRDVVLRLSDNLTRKNKELQSYEAQQYSAAALAGAQDEMTKAQQKEFGDRVATLRTEHGEAVQKANTSKNELQTSYDTQKTELDDIVAKTESEIRAAKQQTADYKEAADKFQAINKDLSEKVDELTNAEFTRSDATVVYADQFLKTVRLNVGEKDGLRPLTTFNIYKPTALDMDKEIAKGSVQVVRSLGEHLCEAKILEDEMSNPIQAGDLAYTPLWRPGKVIKYALDYGLDLDGDGLSDLDQIINIIQSSGAEVAAYIDDEGRLQGEITGDVYRVVRADANIIDVLAHDSSRNDAAREALQRLDQEFLDNAKKNDVPEIFLADFLKAIGYKETAKITRYREREGVDLQDNGVVLPDYSTGVVAPSYAIDPDKAPESPGIIAPTYRKDSDPAPVSSGKVSDYYFRKRTEKAQ